MNTQPYSDNYTSSLAKLATTVAFLDNNSATIATDRELDAPSNITIPAPPELLIMAMASQLEEFKTGGMIHFYWPFVIIPLGLVGNILSFLVMIQPDNRQHSTCNFMAALALSDSVNLLLLVMYWAVVLVPSDSIPIEINRISCKTTTTIANYSSVLGTFLVIAMTVDRFIAVVFPLKAARWCSGSRARKVIAIGAVAILLYNIPVIWMSGLVNRKICSTFYRKDTFTIVYSWLYIMISSMVPFLILLICNGVIIRVVRGRGTTGKVAGSIRQGTGLSSKARADGRAQENQLTAMLLFVTFVFLLFTLPIYIRYIVYTFLEYRSDPASYARYVLIYHITNKMWFTNK